MDSNVGLAIQCVGILLITLFSIFMRSSIKSYALNYWTASWLSLSLVAAEFVYRLSDRFTTDDLLLRLLLWRVSIRTTVHRRLPQPGNGRNAQQKTHLFPHSRNRRFTHTAPRIKRL